MWLVSTRSLGCHSDPHKMLVKHRDSNGCWRVSSWDTFFEASTDGRITVFYIHGNRTDPGADIQQGWAAHDAMMRYGSPEPVRFVIWSWPSSQIRGPIKDVRVKAARTAVDSRFLAWTMAGIPAKTPTSVVGFSYGARIATGALHLLGGGKLLGRRLETPKVATEDAAKNHRSLRVVLLAGALNNYWLNPHAFHGRALSQTDQMYITVNPLDNVLKRYRLVTPHANPQALGFTGLACPRLLGDARERIQVRNVCSIVGREHSNIDIWRSSLAKDIQRYAFWLPVR